MKRRKIGTLEIAEIGLGCMGMSEFYGASDPVESVKTLCAAFELGLDLFDTADAYGRGENERLLGQFVKFVGRSNVVVATKFGILRDPADHSRRSVDTRPEYAQAACEASLKRLGVDHIDLYYVHRVNPEVPIEDTMGALQRLVEQGKIREVGLSEVSLETLLRANAVHPIAAVQSEYSLWIREPEKAVLAACEDLNAAFVAYSPLGRGFLTGKLHSVNSLDEDDFRRGIPMLQGANLEENLNRAAVLSKMADELSCTPAQICLAWLLSRSPAIIPIPGTRSPARLRENIASAEIQLSPENLQALDATFADGANGARTSAIGQAILNN